MSQTSEKKSVVGKDGIHQAILDAVGSIRFGSVEVIVHDSEIVQIECKEKIRFEPRRTRG